MRGLKLLSTSSFKPRAVAGKTRRLHGRQRAARHRRARPSPPILPKGGASTASRRISGGHAPGHDDRTAEGARRIDDDLVRFPERVPARDDVGVEFQIVKARRDDAMKGPCRRRRSSNSPSLHAIGNFKKDRLAVGAEFLASRTDADPSPPGSLARKALTDSRQAKAKIAEGFDEPDFDEVTEAKLDGVVLVLVIWLPQRFGMMFHAVPVIVTTTQPASDGLARDRAGRGLVLPPEIDQPQCLGGPEWRPRDLGRHLLQ